MAKIMGELERAQVEMLSTLPTGADAFKARIVYLTTADGSNLPGFYQHDGTSWVKVGSGASGSGSINYITNPDAETGITGWVTYADAAASTPANGTGGSATTTLTRNTSTPLRGNADFLITKDAANRQGEGGSYDFTISNADKAKTLRVSFDYKTSAAYVDGDIRVYVYDYDPTNLQLIELTTRDLAANTSNGTYLGEFQSNSNSTSYRLIFHIASTNASAYTVNFDNVILGPREIARGPIMTDPVAYTPTFGAGFGTVASVDVKSWRRGKFLCIQGKFITGTVAASAATITVGFGGANANVTIDTAAIAPSGLVGTAQSSLTSTTHFGVYPIAPSSNGTSFAFAVQNSTAALGGGAQNGNIIAATGSLFSFYVELPIVGWSSNANISTDFGSRVIAVRARRGSSDQAIGSTSETTIIFNDKSSSSVYGDTTNSLSTSTGITTVPETGWYEVNAGVALSGCTSAEGMFLYINANSVRVAQTKDDVASANRAFCAASGPVYLLAGQTISAAVQSSVDTAYNVVNDSSTFISISKVQAPQTMLGSEVVKANYTSNNGQSLTTGTIVNFEDLVYDSHSIVTIGASWKATAQQVGNYFVSAKILFASVAWTAGQQLSLQLFKNGSYVRELDFVEIQASVTMPLGLRGSTSIDLNAGDYIDIRVVHDVGAGRAIDTSGNLNYITINKWN